MLRRGIAVAALGLALAGCGGDGGPPPAPTPAAVSGPLCDLLPSGDDPGAPATLADDPAAVALTWIPVLTTFEAAVRAAGMADALDDVTILAPTDDAFAAAFDRGRIDELLLEDHGELRALLEAHTSSRDSGRWPTCSRTAARRRWPAARSRSRRRTAWRGSTAAPPPCAPTMRPNARIHVIDAVLR